MRPVRAGEGGGSPAEEQEVDGESGDRTTHGIVKTCTEVEDGVS